MNHKFVFKRKMVRELFFGADPVKHEEDCLKKTMTITQPHITDELFSSTRCEKKHSNFITFVRFTLQNQNVNLLNKQFCALTAFHFSLCGYYNYSYYNCVFVSCSKQLCEHPPMRLIPNFVHSKFPRRSFFFPDLNKSLDIWLKGFCQSRKYFTF